MSLADKFHSHRGAALALSTLLAVTSVTAPFQNAAAQEPANHPVATKVVAANNNGTQEQLGPLAKAAKFSEQGVGFLFVQGADDNYNYKPLIGAMKHSMDLDKIPSAVFGGRSDRPGTYMVFIVKGVTFTGMPVSQEKVGQMDGYKPDDIRSGRITLDAKRIYQQAFLNQNAKADAPAAAALVASREP